LRCEPIRVTRRDELGEVPDIGVVPFDSPKERGRHVTKQTVMWLAQFERVVPVAEGPPSRGRIDKACEQENGYYGASISICRNHGRYHQIQTD
jgi:hypothetical protein